MVERLYRCKPRKVFEHEKELNEMGLAIPQVTQLMHRLKSEGYPVFENAITVQEARKNLLMYFQGKKKQDCKSKDQNNQDQKSQIESRRKPGGKNCMIRDITIGQYYAADSIILSLSACQAGRY